MHTKPNPNPNFRDGTAKHQPGHTSTLNDRDGFTLERDRLALIALQIITAILFSINAIGYTDLNTRYAVRLAPFLYQADDDVHTMI